MRPGDVPRRRLHEPDSPGHHRHRTAARPGLPGHGRPGLRRLLPDAVLGELGARERPDHPVPLAGPAGDGRADLPEQRVAPPVDPRSRPGYFEPEVPAHRRVRRRSPPAAAPTAARPILVGGGYINKCYGRNGWAIQVTYLNGWPHCSLTAACAAGDTTISGERLHRLGDHELLRDVHRRHRPGRGLRAAGSRPRHHRLRHGRAGDADPLLGAELPASGRRAGDDDASHHRAGVHLLRHRRSAHQGRDHHDDPRGRRGGAVLQRRGRGN